MENSLDSLKLKHSDSPLPSLYASNQSDLSFSLTCKVQWLSFTALRSTAAAAIFIFNFLFSPFYYSFSYFAFRSCFAFRSSPFLRFIFFFRFVIGTIGIYMLCLFVEWKKIILLHQICTCNVLIRYFTLPFHSTSFSLYFLAKVYIFSLIVVIFLDQDHKRHWRCVHKFFWICCTTLVVLSKFYFWFCNFLFDCFFRVIFCWVDFSMCILSSVDFLIGCKQ